MQNNANFLNENANVFNDEEEVDVYVPSVITNEDRSLIWQGSASWVDNDVETRRNTLNTNQTGHSRAR